jgi:predicted TIM-barrel fold metal-dependent hydrolase
MEQFFNCHVHVFTARAAPPRFLPFYLLPIAASPVLGPTVGWLLRNLWPFSKSDRLERLAAFATIGRLESQAAVFERVRDYYSLEFRFVVLTLDMDHMGAGDPKQRYEEQLERAVALRQDEEYGAAVLPFVCADPRRKNLAAFVDKWIDKDSRCVGIKLYPPLGFWPSDPALDDVYALAVEKDLPVLAHCSRGGAHFKGEIEDSMRLHPRTGVRLRGRRRRLFGQYADPDGWADVLARFPKLRLCLAHYGGGEEWRRFLVQAQPVSSQESWIRKINTLIETPEWPNVYADVSSTASNSDNLPLISVLARRPTIRDHVLFGSDYFMIQRDTTERMFGIGLRAAVGEDAWRRMAGTNVRRWLGAWAA